MKGIIKVYNKNQQDIEFFREKNYSQVFLTDLNLISNNRKILVWGKNLFKIIRIMDIFF